MKYADEELLESLATMELGEEQKLQQCLVSAAILRLRELLYAKDNT